jgi:hypothetical protein
MAFNNIKITGNGTAQTVVTNDATLEGVVSGLIAYNTTGGALTFTLLIDGVEVVKESVAANSGYRLPDKLNIPVNAVLTANAATGINLTVSSYQNAIDTAAVLTIAQNLAQAASDDADRAEAALGTTSSPSITGIIKEEVSVSTLTLGATSSVQTYTATANFIIVDDLEDGEFVTFVLTNATFLPTYPTMSWWGDAEPTLGSTDKLFFEKIGATLYGTHVGSIA